MILELRQVLELLRSPLHADQIAKAKRVEERLKLHAEAMMETGEMQARFADFKAWVSTILPPDKVEGFCALWTAPVETNELTESIFGELSRVFSAENPYTRHNFKDSELARDFEQYLTSIKDERFWRTDYWNELKTDVNSIVVVDLAATQTTSKPEPFYYLLDIAHVIDVNVNKKGNIEYLIAETGQAGIILVLDDMHYRTYQVPEDGTGKIDVTRATLLTEVPHNLKRVPAKPMYFAPVNKKERIINHNPITKSLGALDWLLFIEVSKKYLETYAAYPIYATYAELHDAFGETDSRGEEGLEVGIERVLGPGERVYASQNHTNRNRDNKKLVGPGTVQRYDAPRDKDDSDLLANPVQVIPAEEVSLKWCEEQVAKRNAEIFSNCVGKGGDVLNDQAANELQVQSTFESKINILSQIRQRIEECRKYVYEVCAELRYGPLYVSSDVSLGDIYYLSTVKDQQEQLKAGKDSGLPNYELQNQISAIFRNKYRDQPETIQRNEILGQLEPYPGFTVQEVADLVGKGYANQDKLRIKLEFDSLIKRFEREQMNIVDFASARPIQTKIDIIYGKLLEYVKADSSEQKPGGGSQNSGAPGERPLPASGGEGGVEQRKED